MLFGLLWRSGDGNGWSLERKLWFANELAGRKVGQEGFDGLGDAMLGLT